jgi:transposase-like protein
MARFRRGTLTVVEFCQREGVSTPSFYAWRKRLGSAAQPKSRGKQPRGASPSKPASRLFVPVNVSSSPMAEIEFPNGVRVRVPATNIEAIRAALLAGGDPFLEKTSC